MAKSPNVLIVPMGRVPPKVRVASKVRVPLKGRVPQKGKVPQQRTECSQRAPKRLILSKGKVPKCANSLKG